MTYMNLKNKNKLRLENCIGTIIDVHNTVCCESSDQDFLEQFEELNSAIKKLDMDLIREGDIVMVEQATNTLLKEFRIIFETGEFGPVYLGEKN